MKAVWLALLVTFFSIGLAPGDVEAARLGGGGGAGMQRSLPRTPPAAVPARPAPAAPAATPGTPGRSWMGPIAGLAAGLGIAALMSHFGMGAELGNFVMIALLGLVAVFAIRFLMRRFGPASAQSPAMGTSAGPQFSASQGSSWASGQSGSGAATSNALSSTVPLAAGPALPADFDTAGFERIAKTIFIRMQAANDAADLNDLRAFATPEMFAAFKVDLQDRAGKMQQTDVVKVDAEVLDLAVEAGRQIVSVRYHGLIREEKDAVASPFDEVWHLVRPVDGSREWAIAGIQQMA